MHLQFKTFYMWIYTIKSRIFCEKLADSQTDWLTETQ